jgi:hypothetical protein
VNVDATRPPAATRRREHDAWLRAALRHAPDATATPPAALKEAILAEARAVARPARRPGTQTPPGVLAPLAAWWDWLARPPVAAGFATVAMATVIGVLWHDRTLEDTLPDVGRPEATAAAPGATGPTASVAPAAPAPALPTAPSVGAKAEAPTMEERRAAEPGGRRRTAGDRDASGSSSADKAALGAGVQVPASPERDERAEASAARRQSVATPQPALDAAPVPAPSAAPGATAPSPPPSAFPGGARDATTDRERSAREALAQSRGPMEAGGSEAAKPDPAREARAARTDSITQAEVAATPSGAADLAKRLAERSAAATPAAPSRDAPLPAPAGSAGPGPGDRPLASATAPPTLARGASPLAALLAAIDAEPGRWSVSMRMATRGTTGRRALDAPLRRWLTDVDAATSGAWRAASAEVDGGETLATTDLRQDDRVVATLSLAARGVTVATPASPRTQPAPRAASSRSVFAPLAPDAAARLAATLPR